MGDGLRTVRVVTADESTLASARAAITALTGWECVSSRSVDELLAKSPAAGDVILLDGNLRPSVYESCRKLAGKTRCRTYVIVDKGNGWAEPIAHFCGATGVVTRPLSGQDL